MGEDGGCLWDEGCGGSGFVSGGSGVDEVVGLWVRGNGVCYSSYIGMCVCTRVFIYVYLYYVDCV